MKTFKNILNEARPQDYVPLQYQDDEEESTTYTPRAKGEKQFKDAHVVAKKEHPVAQDNQFNGTTKHSGDHEGHAGEPGEREPVKQGSSTFTQFMNKNFGKQTPSRKGDKRQGDMKPVIAKEEIELDEAQKLFMFKTRAEADKKAKQVNGKVLELKRAMDGNLFAVMVKGPGLTNEEVDIQEGVVDTLKKILKQNKAMEVKFKNGKTFDVDPKSAKAILKTHDELNSANAKKMRDSLEKGEQSFMKMLDFAMM